MSRCNKSIVKNSQSYSDKTSRGMGCKFSSDKTPLNLPVPRAAATSLCTTHRNPTLSGKWQHFLTQQCAHLHGDVLLRRNHVLHNLSHGLCILSDIDPRNRSCECMAPLDESVAEFAPRAPTFPAQTSQPEAQFDKSSEK